MVDISDWSAAVCLIPTYPTIIVTAQLRYFK
jgi:hypothetical protein